MSNILKKPLESIFQYVSVLPDTFSAYRYTALQNDVAGAKGRSRNMSWEKRCTVAAQMSSDTTRTLPRIIYCLLGVRTRTKAWWIMDFAQHQVGVHISDVPIQGFKFISLVDAGWIGCHPISTIYSTMKLLRIYRSTRSFVKNLSTHVKIVCPLFNTILGAASGTWPVSNNVTIAKTSSRT